MYTMVAISIGQGGKMCLEEQIQHESAEFMSLTVDWIFLYIRFGF